MHNILDPSPPPRMLQPTLAAGLGCWSCDGALGAALACRDGFCPECRERSRDVSDAHLGGEA